jgi:hypothetical protein
LPSESKSLTPRKEDINPEVVLSKLEATMIAIVWKNKSKRLLNAVENPELPLKITTLPIRLTIVKKMLKAKTGPITANNLFIISERQAPYALPPSIGPRAIAAGVNKNNIVISKTRFNKAKHMHKKFQARIHAQPIAKTKSNFVKS